MLDRLLLTQTRNASIVSERRRVLGCVCYSSEHGPNTDLTGEAIGSKGEEDENMIYTL